VRGGHQRHRSAAGPRICLSMLSALASESSAAPVSILSSFIFVAPSSVRTD